MANFIVSICKEVKGKCLWFSMLFLVLLSACSREYYCSDSHIVPMFIGYTHSDIDTLIVRKYRQEDNFKTLLDTFLIVDDYITNYRVNNDTIGVFYHGTNEITAGFDWQIWIPAVNKQLLVTNMVTEKKTMRCNWGIFSMERTNCSCYNNIFSLKLNQQSINYPDSIQGWYPLYLQR